VALTKVFEVDGRRVGYIFFSNFVQPSISALNDAFAALKTAGANELVLDVRYNGGGLVDVAAHLASLIGARAPTGRRCSLRAQRQDRADPQQDHALHSP
jgi:C-terminal processing protease CtpA/Prc